MKRILMFMTNYEDGNSSGGNIARRTVRLLNDNDYYVIVFTTGDYKTIKTSENMVISVPLGIDASKALLFTRLGIIEDYLDKWVEQIEQIVVQDTLKIGISSDDICLCTTVGELGTLKIGYILKNLFGLRYIIHFHDPIKHAFVNGEKYGMFPLPYASREKYEKKYVEAADDVITCSQTFNEYLCDKYPSIQNKIYNLYFGWMVDANPYELKKSKSNYLRVTYGGIFGWPQGPEILAKAVRDLDNIQVTYVGNWTNYRQISRLRQNNVFVRPRMGHEEYMRFLIEETDVGFLSLSRQYFSACIPAKLYEYINTCLPILAAVPRSDTMNIINKRGYGIATEYDPLKLRNAIQKIKTDDLNNYARNIARERNEWNFNNTMKGLVDIIES